MFELFERWKKDDHQIILNAFDKIGLVYKDYKEAKRASENQIHVSLCDTVLVFDRKTKQFMGYSAGSGFIKKK